MARRLLLVLFAGLLLGSAGCSGNSEVRTVETPDAALLFGYFDLSESPYTLRSVFLTQDEKSGIAYRQSRMRTFTDGLFYQEGLPPMRYHVPFFVAGNATLVLSSSEEDLFGVPAGALVFYGAFKFHDTGEGGVVTAKKFEMRPIKKPSEADVLKMVQARIESPQWKERIGKRLRALGR
jgi:hypothetical protein